MIQKESQHWGTRAKSREELEKTHDIVEVWEHLGHEFAWTINKARKRKGYLSGGVK